MRAVFPLRGDKVRGRSVIAEPRAPRPVMLIDAVNHPGRVSVKGRSAAITGFGAGGKWYTGPDGVMRFGSGVHHVWNGSAYAAVGTLVETGRTDALGGKGWDVGSAADWTRSGLDAGELPTTQAAGLTFTCALESATTGAHGFTRSFALTGTLCAWAVTVLPGSSREWVRIEVDSGAAGRTSQWINTATGAVGVSLGAVSGLHVEKLTGGALIVRGVFSGLTAATRLFRLRSATADGELDYTGDTGKGLYFGPCAVVDGATEVGSLIPSSGVRAADAPQVPGAFFESVKGSGYTEIDFSPNSAESNSTRVLFDCRPSAASTNGFAIAILSNTTVGSENALFAVVNGSSTLVRSAPLSWVPGRVYRIRLEWKGPSWVLSRDGAIVAAASVVGLSTTGASVYLGCNVAGASHADGAIRATRVGAI